MNEAKRSLCHFHDDKPLASALVATTYLSAECFYRFATDSTRDFDINMGSCERDEIFFHGR